MSFYFNWPSMILLLSVVIYFFYDHFEKKRVSDEREEFIKLKTFELVQKITTISLLVLTSLIFFIPEMSGLVIIFVLITSSLYSEIIAKWYYRKKY